MGEEVGYNKYRPFPDKHGLWNFIAFDIIGWRWERNRDGGLRF
jgi:hypothetical protein